MNLHEEIKLRGLKLIIHGGGFNNLQELEVLRTYNCPVVFNENVNRGDVKIIFDKPMPEKPKFHIPECVSMESFIVPIDDEGILL